MLHKILCIPNFDLPQKVDLNSMREELKKENLADKVEKCYWDSDDSYLDTKTDEAFAVLPLHSPPNATLRKQLSLHHNKYLSKKFNQFLNNIPKEWTKVLLYQEVKYTEDKPIPRRMKLNGRFYDVDNKLAPAPVFPDPRQYCMKKNDCNKLIRKTIEQ